MKLSPFLNALGAAAYIALIVSLMQGVIFQAAPHDSIFIPMAMLALLVLSVAVMAALFFYEPVRLLIEGKRPEAVAYFGKTLGAFALFVLVLVAAMLYAG